VKTAPAPPLKHADFGDWCRALGFNQANLTLPQRKGLLRLFAAHQRQELRQAAANTPENREIRTNLPKADGNRIEA
jgi:hypothetical protein